MAPPLGCGGGAGGGAPRSEGCAAPVARAGQEAPDAAPNVRSQTGPRTPAGPGGGVGLSRTPRTGSGWQDPQPFGALSPQAPRLPGTGGQLPHGTSTPEALMNA